MYQELGRPKETYRSYNVLNECLLEEDDDKLVLHVIPPPELHLLMHVVTKIVDLMWEDVKTLFENEGIFRHGYNGGGFDGKILIRSLKT